MMKLKKELDNVKMELERTKNAILDMMNYSDMFVLVLDEKMNIKFINWSLSTSLGFKNEFEPIGRCWIDFIKKDERNIFSDVHNAIKSTDMLPDRYKEVVNNIVSVTGNILTIKWFNTRINNNYEWTFSFGLLVPVNQVKEESIRSYYHDILKRDRTAILSVRDRILNGSNKLD